MISIKKEGIILLKTILPFEDDGVLNPAIMQEGKVVHMFYRAVRKGNYSTIGYCRLDDPLTVVERHEKPILSPEFEYESHGVEDPRIVKIEDVYYLSYTAYDGVNAMGALATSTDLKHFEKQGMIVPQFTYEEFKCFAESNAELNQKYERFHLHNNIKNNPDKKMLLWDKNVIFFPRKIKNKLYFLHRIRPDIQIVSVDNIQELTKEFWKKYFLHLTDNIVLSPKYKHEVSYVGGGCPPIETAHGWLLIYHGVCDSTSGYVYSACAALLDLENPGKEIARLPYSLFSPEYQWELRGEVNNVVFPTGTALFGDTLYIYYGAADEQIACASLSLKSLLKELLSNKIK
ncbi:MAG: pesticidal protein Cry7Aa [Bacteroidota bacterium]|nr:pesticidal protein Cry7Aa [Bacteroidota bacterium]